MEKSRLSYLFHQYYDNLSTPEEEMEFMRFIATSKNLSELEGLIESRWQKPAEEISLLSGLAQQRTWAVISEKVQQRSKIRKINSAVWDRITIAAAALLIFFGSALCYYITEVSGPKTPQVTFAKKIVPGGNKAILTLADGHQITLTDARNGQIAAQSGITITKAKDGQLVYSVVPDGNRHLEVENNYNTVETPNGGQYSINLPDGSLVMLNAASRLRFPTSFSGGQRKVELIGEGYFEVAKDKNKPFIVQAGKQDVKVLGTHFNVNAYGNERIVKTTLLEGSVLVNEHTYLKPGEQAVSKGWKIDVLDADIENEVAWKNGRFSFTGNEFETIMNNISRWYDVEIVYDYKPEKLRISGGISRLKNIKDVLDLIQETEEVKFKIEGRRVRVIQ